MENEKKVIKDEKYYNDLIIESLKVVANANKHIKESYEMLNLMSK